MEEMGFSDPISVLVFLFGCVWLNRSEINDGNGVMYIYVRASCGVSVGDRDYVVVFVVVVVVNEFRWDRCVSLLLDVSEMLGWGSGDKFVMTREGAAV